MQNTPNPPENNQLGLRLIDYIANQVTRNKCIYDTKKIDEMSIYW